MGDCEVSEGRPADKIRNQADALRITKPAMRQLGLRWHSMKPLALLCMLNEIWRKERVNLPEEQKAMRIRYKREPKPPKVKAIRRRVISVGLSELGGYIKLTLECGHFVLSNSELAPHSAECRICAARGENQK